MASTTDISTMNLNERILLAQAKLYQAAHMVLKSSNDSPLNPLDPQNLTRTVPAPSFLPQTTGEASLMVLPSSALAKTPFSFEVPSTLSFSPSGSTDSITPNRIDLNQYFSEQCSIEVSSSSKPVKVIIPTPNSTAESSSERDFLRDGRRSIYDVNMGSAYEEPSESLVMKTRRPGPSTLEQRRAQNRDAQRRLRIRKKLYAEALEVRPLFRRISSLN